jgi:hypothetical protein
MDLKIFQINSVMNSGVSSPQLVNYRHIGLFKKTIQDKGLDIKTEFYQYFDNNIYSNLIVEEVYTYIEQNPLYLGVTTDVNWYDLADVIGDTQSFTYMFLPNEIIEFGIKKRSNVLSNAKLYAFQQLGANAYTLLDNCQGQMSIYVQGNTAPLLAQVNTQVGVVTGLTQPIADNINSILSNL